MKRFPPSITWDNWGSVMLDVELFTPVVREVCAIHDIVYRELRAGFPGTHAVFCLDDALVVKLFAPLHLPDADVEQRIYRMLKRHRLPMVSQLIGEGTVRAAKYTWPYLVIEYMRGQAAREIWPRLAELRRIEIGSELGRFAVQYHAMPDPFDERSTVSALSWPEQSKIHLKKNLDRMAEVGFSARLLHELREFVFRKTAERERTVMLIHSDLTEDHLLIDGDRLSVIDFADSRMAYECLEWVTLWFGLFTRDRLAYQAFIEASGGRVDAEELLLGTMLHGFGGPILQNVLGDQLADIQTIDELMAWLP